MRNKKLNLKNSEMVQKIGSKTQWRKLPDDIRIIINKRIIKLTRIHHAISSDANLPMPPIRVEPWGWVYPEMDAAIFAQLRPIAQKAFYQFNVIVPASTLVVIDDDNFLRRLICHEFDHFMWYMVKIIQALNAGESKLNESQLEDKSLERYSRKLQMDKDKLVNPSDFFGKWDSENFFYGPPDPALDAATEAFCDNWIIKGLPTRKPSLEFNVQGITIPSEISKRINDLLRVTKFGGELRSP